MKKQLPSVETLRQLLDYDPETGILTWKPRPVEMFRNHHKRICATWNTRYAGKEALGQIDKTHGYKIGSINGVNYLAHRVAWKLCTGKEPSGEIDHVNMKRSDNRITNLRDATRAENQHNRRFYATNTSGYKGVTWHKTTQKWAAQIMKSGKNHHLGLFDCPKEAYAAYCKAAKELHGEYANTV